LDRAPGEAGSTRRERAPEDSGLCLQIRSSENRPWIEAINVVE